MSDIKNINKRMEITPKKERLGGILPAKYSDEAITLGQLSDIGINPNVSYKKYVAILLQTSTNAPVATVLENTIGDIVWSRSGAGSYLGTLTGAFTVGKTIVNGPHSADVPNNTNADICSSGSDNANTVYVITSYINPSAGTCTQGDDRLYGAGYSHIEIIVYN